MEPRFGGAHPGGAARGGWIGPGLLLALVASGCAATYVPSRPRIDPSQDLETRIQTFQRHRLREAGGMLSGTRYWNLANPERQGEWPDVDLLFEQFEETRGTMTTSRVLGVMGEVASALGSGLTLAGALCISGRGCVDPEVDTALLASGVALELVASALTIVARTLYGDLGDAYDAALFERLGLGPPLGPAP